MIEKVNPSHPDKIADRIAGAIVDIAYQVQPDPKIAVEVLIGHGVAHVIVETSAPLLMPEAVRAIHDAIRRIAGFVQIDLCIVPQDAHLADNQSGGFRCGDNGIFKGMPLTDEQKTLSEIAHEIYEAHPFDGKYILDGERLIICQSNVSRLYLEKVYPKAEINPLGDWTGGTDVEPARPTASSVLTWLTPLPAADCTARTCPKRTCPSISTHSSKLRRPGSRLRCAAPLAMRKSTACRSRTSLRRRGASYSPSAGLKSSLSGGCFKRNRTERRWNIDWNI